MRACFWTLSLSSFGALEYLAWVGETFGGHYAEKFPRRGGGSINSPTHESSESDPPLQGFHLHLRQAMAVIRAYEYELSRALLEVLEETPGVTVYGPRDMRALEGRVPTFSFTVQGMHPCRVAEKLDEAGIYVWDGNYYALAVTERLGLEESGGMVRVGAVHYNTIEEVGRLGEVLAKITSSVFSCS